MTKEEKLKKVRAEIERRYKDNLNAAESFKEGDVSRTYFGAIAKEDYDLLSLIDSIQEEPKKCIYTKDNYTDEDRKVLCEGCEEECKFNKKEEPVSDDLEAAIDNYLATYFGGEKEKQEWPFLKKMAIHFSAWQKQQLMAKAVDGYATFEFYGFDDKTYGCIAQDPICFDDMGLKDTDKVKVIVIKEDLL